MFRGYASLDAHLEPCSLCGGDAHVEPDDNFRETGVSHHVVCARCGNEHHITSTSVRGESAEVESIMAYTGCSERTASLVYWWNHWQRSSRPSYSTRGIDLDAYVQVDDIDEIVQVALDEGWDTRRFAFAILNTLRNCSGYPDC